MLWLLNLMMKSKIRNSLDLLVSIARNITIEEYSDGSRKNAIELCKIGEDNMDFLFENPVIINPLFYKLCKLLAMWQGYESDGAIRAKLVSLLVLMWERNQKNCLHIGRELVRITQPILKSSDFEYFIRQFSAKSPISE